MILEKKLSIAEALRFAWNTTLNHFWLILGVVLTFGLVETVQIGILAGLVGINLVGAFSSSTFSIFSLPESAWIGLIALQIIFGVLFLTIGFRIISAILNLGSIKMALQLYNYDKTHYAELFSCARLIFKYIGAFIAYAAVVGIGMILLVVPGIIWALKYYFFTYALVDKDMKVFEALSYSSEITYGYKKDLLLLFIVLGLLNMLGSLAFGIGLLFTIPMTRLAIAYTYKQLSLAHAQR